MPPPLQRPSGVHWLVGLHWRVSSGRRRIHCLGHYRRQSCSLRCALCSPQAPQSLTMNGRGLTIIRHAPCALLTPLAEERVPPQQRHWTLPPPLESRVGALCSLTIKRRGLTINTVWRRGRVRRGVLVAPSRVDSQTSRGLTINSGPWRRTDRERDGAGQTSLIDSQTQGRLRAAVDEQGARGRGGGDERRAGVAPFAWFWV